MPLYPLRVALRASAAPLRPAERRALPDLHRVATLLADRRLTYFLPVWVAMSAIMGMWLTAQLSFALTARVHVRGQQFVDLLRGHAGRLGLVLGASMLLFSLFVVVRATLLGRLPRPRTLLVIASGALPARWPSIMVAQSSSSCRSCWWGCFWKQGSRRRP